MGGNDINHSGRINASGNITTAGTMQAGYFYPGEKVMWGSSVLSADWLELNGQSFNKSQYPDLSLLYPSVKLPDTNETRPKNIAVIFIITAG